MPSPHRHHCTDLCGPIFKYYLPKDDSIRWHPTCWHPSYCLEGQQSPKAIEQPVRTKSKKVIIRLLGMASEIEFDQWHDGEWYGNIWKDLYESCIMPLREEAERSGKARMPVITLEAVERRTKTFDSSCIERFEELWPGKDSWDTIEYYAVYLGAMRFFNTWNTDLFDRGSGENLTEHQMNCLLWTVIQYDLHNTTKSQLKLAAERKRKAEERGF
ncbi:hypothetical protein LTR84_000787 [Exophiala bonariae]|uniref:Uncharacterized protein n=1 Tax=Exophiala bonariae TaxID=1690606 RepID=A0AAV9NVL4_9EURO|nr:hypothetical protein LTR84_000787 [Exophiala bonariae]